MKFASPVCLARHFRDAHPNKRNTQPTIVGSHPGSFSEKEIDYKLQTPSTSDDKPLLATRSSSRLKKPLHNMFKISNTEAVTRNKEKENSGDEGQEEALDIEDEDLYIDPDDAGVIRTAYGPSAKPLADGKKRSQKTSSPQVLIDPSTGLQTKLEEGQDKDDRQQKEKPSSPQEEVDESTDLEGFRTDRSAMCVFCWKNRSLCKLKEADPMVCFVCFERVPCTDLDRHTLQKHPYLPNGYFTCRGGNVNEVSDSETIIGRRVVSDFGIVSNNCALCGFTCPLVQALKNHVQSRHNINANTDKICFKCDKCYVYFATALARNNHVHFCHGYGPPECSECSERFSSPVMLRKHMNEQHEGAKKPEISFRKRQQFQQSTEGISHDIDTNNYPTASLKENIGAGITVLKGDAPTRGKKRKHNSLTHVMESEGYRSDRSSICLYCWKTDTLCDEAIRLKCFLCSTTVSSDELDSHASKYHPEMSFGVYTCQGRRTVELPQKYGILSRKDQDREKYHCMLCDFIADDPKSIKLHLVEIHKIKNSKAKLSSIARCNTCLSFFSNVIAAEDHQFFCHAKEVKIALPECLQCDMRFSAPNAYKKHMRTAHGEVRKTNLDTYAETMEIDEEKVKNMTPFSFSNTCKEPNLEYHRPDRKSLCVHCWKLNKRCDDVELLKCFVCFDSVNVKDLDAHALTHPNCNSGLYTCLGIHNGRLRNTSVYGTVGRKIPAASPESADSYECFRCFFNTQNLQHFKDHLGARHDVKVSKSNFVPRCRYCHLFFTANSVQEDHEYFCRGADLPYCADCNIRFASPNSWRRHCNEVHIGKYGPRKYFSNTKYSGSLLCETCGISFKNKPAMKYHNKTRHGGVKGGQVPYEDREKHVCDFCGATFLRQHSLQEHVNFRHTKSKSFKCKQCERYFLRKSELARHEQMHGKSVAIKCSMCNFQGFTKFELRRHFFKDHKIGQFKCTCCRAKFTDYEKYEEHKFLKLCPRYNVTIDEKGKRRRMNRKNAQYHQEYEEMVVADGGAGDQRDDHQLCTWVTETGEMMQAYIRRDMINSEGELQDGLQVLELPNGEMQLVQASATEEVQGGAEEIAVTQIQEGNVQLVQMETNDIPIQVPVPSDSTGTTSKTIVLPQSKAATQVTSTDDEPYELQVVQMADGSVEVRQGADITHSSQDESQQFQIKTEAQNISETDAVVPGVKYLINDESKIGEIETQDGTVIEYEIIQDNVKKENRETVDVSQEPAEDIEPVETKAEGEHVDGTRDEVKEKHVQDGEASVEGEEAVEINDDENVTEMSLEAFQATYGEGALQAVEKEQGKDGYYIVYV